MSSENVLFYKQRKILKCGCARLPDHITEQRRYEAQRDLRPLTRPAELPPSPHKVAVLNSDGMVHVHKVKRDTFELCSKISYRKLEANYT